MFGIFFTGTSSEANSRCVYNSECLLNLKGKATCGYASQEVQAFISRVPKSTATLKNAQGSIQDGQVEGMALSPNPSPTEKVKICGPTNLMKSVGLTRLRLSESINV